MLRHSTRWLEQSSGIVLVGTAHPLMLHLLLNTASHPSRASHGPTHMVEYKWLRQPLCCQWCMVGGYYVLLDFHSPAILCPQSCRIFEIRILFIHCKCACPQWISLCNTLLKSANPSQPAPVLLHSISLLRSYTLTSCKSFQECSTQLHHITWHFVMSFDQRPNKCIL